MKIEHIGIAVKNIQNSNLLFEKIFNSEAYKSEKVASENVTTSFFKVGESKIELLEATDPASPIAKFIEKKGEGIHHIAFEVADIYKEMERLKKEGFQLINEQPKKGADNKLVCFSDTDTDVTKTYSVGINTDQTQTMQPIPPTIQFAKYSAGKRFCLDPTAAELNNSFVNHAKSSSSPCLLSRPSLK